MQRLQPEIRKELYEESSGPGQSVVRSQSYVGAGMRRVESRFIQLESDHSDDNARRFSEDNGRTWSAWEGFQNALYRMQGADELATSNMVPAFSRSFNPVHGHLVGVYQHTVFVNGHREAFRSSGAKARRDSSTMRSCTFPTTMARRGTPRSS